MKFFLNIFCDFLCAQSEFFDFFAMTIRTACRDSILGLADMTESDSISGLKFMIADA